MSDPFRRFPRGKLNADDEEGVDVSEIAKAHGGGGHKHAAGFEQTIEIALAHAEDRPS